MTSSKPATRRWSTTHLAALADPDDTPPFVAQPRHFSAQTLRQAVRLRRGGCRVRLVLSNQYGRTPLVIDQVTLESGDTGTVVPAFRRGAGRWEIAPGQNATSDPVALPVQAGELLVVSCFAAGRAEPAAYLHAAQQSGQVAPGNQLGHRQLTDSDTFASLYWITQVLVDEPATGPVIIALGDSITRGDGTTIDHDQRYPDHLQRHLLAVGMHGAVVLNAGIGANRLLRPHVGPSMTDRFTRDVLSVAEATHVIIMGGINDLGLPSLLGEQQPTAEAIIDRLLALAHRAQQHGIQPVLGTITPMLASRYESFRLDGNEDIRHAINQAILTQNTWPVADFATALARPDDPMRLAPALDSGDGIHPSDAGARALADILDPVAFLT
jgi:lysophospholipase L1-like esterase